MYLNLISISRKIDGEEVSSEVVDSFSFSGISSFESQSGSKVGDSLLSFSVSYVLSLKVIIIYSNLQFQHECTSICSIFPFSAMMVALKGFYPFPLEYHRARNAKQRCFPPNLPSQQKEDEDGVRLPWKNSPYYERCLLYFLSLQFQKEMAASKFASKLCTSIA